MMRELQWKKADDWHLASEPAGFTICRCSMEDGWKLQAWHGSQHLLTTEGEAGLAACKNICQFYFLSATNEAHGKADGLA